MGTIIPTLSKKFSDRPHLMFAVMLAIMAGVWCTSLTNMRPVIHREAESFLVFYGNPTGGFWSEVSKFFDPASTDWDAYQARELAYGFEYIDAQASVTLKQDSVLFIRFSQHHANLFRHSNWVRVVFHRKGVVTHV